MDEDKGKSHPERLGISQGKNMAERVGFEPTVDLRPQRLSRPPD